MSHWGNPPGAHRLVSSQQVYSRPTKGDGSGQARQENTWNSRLSHTPKPNADTGQIRLNKMKLSMAVGAMRHYVINTIAPRHFEQTAAECGIPAAVLWEIFDEILDIAPKALRDTIAKLPTGFPEQVAASITEGRARSNVSACCDTKIMSDSRWCQCRDIGTSLTASTSRPSRN